MIKRLIIFILLYFYFNSAFATPRTIEQFINQWQRENKIPAVSFIIKAPRYNLYYLSGTTTLNGNKKIDDRTLFGIGSITKTFIAAMILQLQEANQLNLDDHLSKYFPEYPKWSNITLRQLLNMTSGIPNFTKSDTFKKLIANKPTEYHPLSFFINMAYVKNNEFFPGKVWLYSNTNYYLLGMIIEKVTHSELNTQLEQRFFKTLHLKNTYYSSNTMPTSVLDKKAHAYLGAKDVTNQNPAYTGPAGGMVMNAKDLSTWIQALFTPGRILTEKSLKELMTTQIVPTTPPKPEGSSYGLGLYSLKIPGYGLVWWYTGVVDGYSSVFLFIPERKIIIVGQINRWQDNYGLLMPGQALISEVMRKLK